MSDNDRNDVGHGWLQNRTAILFKDWLGHRACLRRELLYQPQTGICYSCCKNTERSNLRSSLPIFNHSVKMATLEH